MSLKSAPSSRGVRRMTSRSAATHRRAHLAAAFWPAPVLSLSTKSVSVLIPASTGKFAILSAQPAEQKRAAMGDVQRSGERGSDTFAEHEAGGDGVIRP